MALSDQSQTSISMRTMEMGAQNAIYIPGSQVEHGYVENIPVREVPHAYAKRTLDILMAGSALVLFSWLFVIVALLIKLTSRGPVIFKQIRVGKGGKHFMCYKFRSMCADAEKKKQSLLHLNEVSGPVFKIKNDPRITPVGHFIRKCSIDELPQLWNVLKGEMSIVGPRPPLPHEVVHYTSYQQGRLSVKPGLTCLWQINGRSNIDFQHWVEMDMMYIESMSFMNDLKIILKTIPAVITGRGAQ
jgi:exopolysaccharide biosynthesis polyprenyl glycosylphosphotransferase